MAYRTLSMDVPAMSSLLAQAPMWHTQEAEDKVVLLTLPMPDGSFQDFRIAEAPVMHPDLSAQFPMIKSYAGIGIDDPTAYLRFDMTQRGFHAMILTAKSSTVFIDPYSTADIGHYISYYKKDFHKDEPFECWFDDKNQEKKGNNPPSIAEAGDCQFRTYVLALACTGEYASFHGGTVALALAAMNTSMTRVNGVFENDASIHMTLHPNTSSLIYLNAGTDPYTNDDGGAMLAQNQTTCDNVIGNANYDIGHVFSTGGGGVAYLGAVCSNSIKAGGVTGQPSPIGDPFDIDYVAHEMGHQYGANHTQNNNCNRNSATAMEPGSASTIMGYAGICAPNVQNNSDDYFHAISIQEIAAEITSNGTGGGNTCSTNATLNGAPTADAGPNYTIPISTPFVLSGTGTDPNGDPLTYTWEQMDNQVATMPPVSTSTTGPAFRSYKGTTSPSRYLPRLTDLVNNVSPTWEVLASVSRSYNWRMTVRDNHIGGGCTAEDNMVVTVSNTSGPFVVTAPNTAVTWPALSTQTVTWNVANTTAAPVSCANVDILLSLDGGFTYPITLATATPNDGTHSVSIPNNQTTQARIMVRGSGNIFFDISNTNFTIGAPLNTFSLDVVPNSLGVCVPSNAVYSVNIGVLGTFSGSVTLSASGQPSGSVVSFSPNPVVAPGTSQLTISNLAAVVPGTYNIMVTGISGIDQHSETVTLTVGNGIPGAVSLSLPANGSTYVDLMPILSWVAIAGASTYELQVATDAGFTNLIINQTGLMAASYDVTSPLSQNTLYYWRARAVNPCGNGNYSAVFTFTTTSNTCTTYASTDVPKTISSSGTPTVTSILNIPDAGAITDLNVLNLRINHTYINNLIVRLKSPANTERILLNQICGSQNNIIINLDDESSNPYSSIPCPPTNNGTYQPFQTLSNFDGENLNGTWTLTINDMANQSGGSLQAWSLQVCSSPIPPPLTIVANGTDVTCNGGNDGAASASASGGVGAYVYAWSNGSSSQNLSGLTAGTYTVTVTSGNESTSTSVTVSQPAETLVSAPAVTQPTCATPTGTIVVNASGGTLEYSVDNGMTYEASNTFSGLDPDAYNIMVRLQAAPSCTTAFASNPVLINAAPTAPIISGANITQPTCAVPTGSILINASGNGDLEYSIDNGGNYQSPASFSGLAAEDYSVLVRLQSVPTCTTAYVGNPVTIVAALGAPTVNAPDLVQPTCAVPTGSILVNASGNGALEYSIDNGGNYQSSASFSGLASGDYSIVVRLEDDPTCATAYAGNPVAIDPVPLAPMVTAPIVTQSTCLLPTGSILVNASGNGALEYSIDNGGDFQSIPLFTALTPGSYNIVVRLQNNPTCATAYTGNPVTISAALGGPTVSAPDLAQPTCAVPTGSILVNASGNGDLEYSIDNGGNYQSSATFSGLAAGDYNILVRLQSDPTCATAYMGNPVTIIAALGGPTVNAPDLTQPTCAMPTGSILVNASGNGTLEYSIDNGGNYQSSATFSGLAAGDYNILVRLQEDPTCAAAYTGNPVTITPAPSAPVVDAPTITQPTCSEATGSIVVNASGAGDLEYSIDNGNSYQTSATFSGLAVGEYNIVVRLQSDADCSTVYNGNPIVLSAATNCCPATLAVDMTPIPDGTYEAEIELTSSGLVSMGGNVVFGAWETIELQPGFEVELGGVLEILLQGCTQ